MCMQCMKELIPIRDRNSAELRTYCSEKTSTATIYNNLFQNYGISIVGKIAPLLPVTMKV